MAGRKNQEATLRRLRWIADLDEAAGRAQRLAWELGFEVGDSAEARELYGRLELIRAEISALARRRPPAVAETSPEWMRKLWN